MSRTEIYVQAKGDKDPRAMVSRGDDGWWQFEVFADAHTQGGFAQAAQAVIACMGHLRLD